MLETILIDQLDVKFFFLILLRFHCRIASFSIEFMLKSGLQINSLLYTWERLYFWRCLKKSRFLFVYQYCVIRLDILKNQWISIKLDWNLIKCLWFLGPDQIKNVRIVRPTLIILTIFEIIITFAYLRNDCFR